MFTHIKKADRSLMFLNVLLLANVAFLPFPMQLLANAMHQTNQLRAAAFFYGLMLTVSNLFFNTIWHYVAAHPDMLKRLSDHDILQRQRRALVGLVAYAVATILSLLWPPVAIACYAALIIYFLAATHW